MLTAAIAAALTTSLYAQAYQYTTVPGDPMQSRIYTLDNGLKVYLSVNKEKPRIQTYIAVRTGSRNDPAETTGLAHYLEHIMFKGTNTFGTSDYAAERPFLDDITARYEAYRKLTDPQARKQAYHEIDSVSQLTARYNIPNEYDKLMASIGAEGTNAYTSNDVTCYVEDIPANEVDTWAKVQAERFQNMVVRGFHTELESVYEEFNIGLAQDNRKMWAALNKKLFPTHPYGTQTTIGTQEHLKNPSIVNILNYYHRYYVPNNVAICMAGDFDPDQVIAIIDKYFKHWKKSDNLSRPEYAPLPPLTAPVDTTVVGQEAEYAMLGWRMPAAASAQADTLTVIAELLANGKAGLFDTNLNLPMKVQWAGAFYEGMTDYGQFDIQVQPKQGQSLEEAKALVLAEVEKLKRGEFADDLLPSVVNNMKRSYYESLRSNADRADKFVTAFINGQKWEDQVHALDRISAMTKTQVVAFANKHLLNNYVTVYKRQGTDTTVHKIEKPAITPIPTNNDKQSDFLKRAIAVKSEPIQPRFIDFGTDLVKKDLDSNTRMLYKQDATDKLFDLAIDFPVGHEQYNGLPVAQELMEYAGTDKRSANDLKKDFYRLGCDFSVRVYTDHTRLTVSGLAENMPQAVGLATALMSKAQISTADYKNVVELILKDRDDAKKNQRKNFSALQSYGVYGSFSPMRNTMPAQQLKGTDGNSVLALLRNLRANYPATVMYYGPANEKDVATLVKKVYPRRKADKMPAASLATYQTQPTRTNEVWLAPYDAKNIYMVQYHDENRSWTPENAPINALFNEYFGGGMNTIVFQELREARGLAYSASARYHEPYRKQDKESFNTYIITQSDKMMDCINEFNHLLDSMPVRPAAFDLAKQSLTKSLATARTTRFAVLNAYMSAQQMGLDYDINRTIYDKIPSLTLSDLEAFARDRIANRPYRYLILGDENNLDLKSLEKIAPIRRVTTEEIFGY